MEESCHDLILAGGLNEVLGLNDGLREVTGFKLINREDPNASDRDVLNLIPSTYYTSRYILFTTSNDGKFIFGDFLYRREITDLLTSKTKATHALQVLFGVFMKMKYIDDLEYFGLSA